MKLFVQNLNDKTLLLDVMADSTIGEVKDKLYAREGIPAIAQRLFYAGKWLSDDRTLADYSIAPDSTFSLLLQLKGGFQIFVVEAEGKTITIVVEPADTILNLKTKISERISVDTCEQYLMYAGKPLEETKTVRDYNIQRDATVFLSIKLRGGDRSD